MRRDSPAIELRHSYEGVSSFLIPPLREQGPCELEHKLRSSQSIFLQKDSQAHEGISLHKVVRAVGIKAFLECLNGIIRVTPHALNLCLRIHPVNMIAQLSVVANDQHYSGSIVSRLDTW
jgi:hypothetical protein